LQLGNGLCILQGYILEFSEICGQRQVACREAEG
jgi:hypothetical protein